jgi:glucose-6-phosphate isomerase
VLRRNNTPEIANLLRSEPDRCRDMVVTGGDWRFDASRIPLPLDDWRAIRAPRQLDALRSAVDALFGGAIVNPSENRPALHMALRASDPGTLCDAGDADLIRTGRDRLLDAAGRLHGGDTGIRTLLHAGIGGSDLGPRLVADALGGPDSAVDVEWLTTLDARRLKRLLERLDPAETGLVVASKSFSTVETLTQARAIRDWLGPAAGDRIWAATADRRRAREFGVADEHVLAFPDWVGGRFSLWSGVGLSAAAVVGAERWRALLRGAETVDRSVATDPAGTQALALALSIDVLVRRYGFGTLGVVAYDPRLRLLAEYLQQLVMESLGKRVQPDGSPVEQATSPLVFGGAGTDLQHSLFQALHQGTTRHPVLLVGTSEDVPGYANWQREQLAHLLGQASALVNGTDAADPQRELPGNNPVLLMLAHRLSPEALGALLATFEHAVYLLGVLWRINPFDQWGVEEGKRLAGAFREALQGGEDGPDATLSATLEWLRRQS